MDVDAVGIDPGGIEPDRAGQYAPLPPLPPDPLLEFVLFMPSLWQAVRVAEAANSATSIERIRKAFIENSVVVEVMHAGIACMLSDCTR